MSPISPSLVRKWFRHLAGLLRSWWIVDRIRIAPSEGTLLRLRCGDLIYFDDDWLEIETRTVTAGPDCTVLTYDCAAIGRRVRLSVRPAECGNAAVVLWDEDDELRVVGPDDIEVFPRRAAC